MAGSFKILLKSHLSREDFPSPTPQRKLTSDDNTGFGIWYHSYFYKPTSRCRCWDESTISEWVSSSSSAPSSSWRSPIPPLPVPASLATHPDTFAVKLWASSSSLPLNSCISPSIRQNQKRLRLDWGEGKDPLKLRDLLPGQGLAQTETKAAIMAKRFKALCWMTWKSQGTWAEGLKALS